MFDTNQADFVSEQHAMPLTSGIREKQVGFTFGLQNFQEIGLQQDPISFSIGTELS